MGLEQIISRGVDTAFLAVGDQARAITLSGPGTATYNPFADTWTTSAAGASVATTAVRYEGKTIIAGVETNTGIYLVRVNQLSGNAVDTAWKILDTADGDTVPREIIAIGRPHTTILLLHVATTEGTT